MMTDYEIMYVLSPGGAYNYEPTAQFLDYLPANVRSRISLAICLDGMVDSSRSLKAGQLLNIYENEHSSRLKEHFLAQLEQLADQYETGIGAVERHGDSKRRDGEHVVFGERGIPAITISAFDKEEGESPIQKYSILDRDLSTEKLVEVLDLISEGLMQTIVTKEVRQLDVPLLLDTEGKATGKPDC